MYALRPFALSFLLFNSAAAISQTAGIANNPYTATKKVTFVQKLADGTTITRTTTSTDARDSQSRTVHEDAMPEMPGENSKHIFVMDPVAHTTTTWMSPGTTATRMHLLPRQITQPSGSTALGSGSGLIGMVLGSSDMTSAGSFSADPNLRPQRRAEKLGGKTIAGVYAEGTRITFTYPVGFFGNDRPIVNVMETWTSPDLRLVVLATNDDPRTGLRTTELTNLVRSEPDPALFQVPEGYTVKDHYPGSN